MTLKRLLLAYADILYRLAFGAAAAYSLAVIGILAYHRTAGALVPAFYVVLACFGLFAGRQAWRGWQAVK